MSPERAARTLANIGAALLALALLLRGLSLVDAYTQSKRKAPSPSYNALPFLGNYTFSPSGAQVGFQQGWVPAASSGAKGRKDDFYLDMRTGQFSPGSLPPDDLGPFTFRDHRIWLAGDGQYSITSGSPPNMDVDASSLARSPDGTLIAFTAWKGAGTLYILSASGQLGALVQSEALGAPSWSPDGQALTFAMHRADAPETGAQIYSILRDGTGLRQLTHGDQVATSPRWSPDGQRVAFLQIPVSPSRSPGPGANLDIGIVDSSGANQRKLTHDGGAKRQLTWIAGTRQIVYTTPSADWKTVEELRVIDAGADSPQSTRLYPPVTVESLECPKTLPRDGSGVVQITVQNSGPQPVAVPLVLRAGKQLIPLVNTGPGTPPPNQPPAIPVPAPTAIPEQRRQIIALDGSAQTTGEGTASNGTVEQRTLEWPARPVPGLVTYLSTLVLPEGQFPVSEKHCVVRNTYFGLPNLPYLPTLLPLTIAGMLLTIPWLRHERKLYWWALWLVVPLLLAVLIALEIRLIPPLNI